MKGQVDMLEKKYGIFHVNKNGVLLGYVENSFNMDWSPNYVRAWTLEEVKDLWNNKLSSFGKKKGKPFKKYKKGIKSRYPEAFIARITSNYPIQFQKKLGKKVCFYWKERQRILNRTEEEQKERYISKKYHYRNVQFSICK